MAITLSQIIEDYDGEDIIFELSGEEAVEQASSCSACDAQPVPMMRVTLIESSGTSEDIMACMRCGAAMT